MASSTLCQPRLKWNDDFGLTRLMTLHKTPASRKYLPCRIFLKPPCSSLRRRLAKFSKSGVGFRERFYFGENSRTRSTLGTMPVTLSASPAPGFATPSPIPYPQEPFQCPQSLLLDGWRTLGRNGPHSLS
jgi:hypothetical protein